MHTSIQHIISYKLVFFAVIKWFKVKLKKNEDLLK